MNKEIAELESRIRADQKRLTELKREEELAKLRQKFNPVGIWKVTTQGDCEGRTVRDFGTYQGNIFDLIPRFTENLGYTLDFEYQEPIGPSEKPKAHHGETSITVQHPSIKLYDKGQTAEILSAFAPEGVEVRNSSHYGAVKVRW